MTDRAASEARSSPHARPRRSLHLRSRLEDAPQARPRSLEERLLETKESPLAQAVARTEREALYTLREASASTSPLLRDEVDKLTAAAVNPTVRSSASTTDGHGRRTHQRRKMLRVAVASRDRDRAARAGARRSSSTRAFNVVWHGLPRSTGEVVTVKDVMETAVRVLVVGRADEERVCELARRDPRHSISAAATMSASIAQQPASSRSSPRPEVEDLLLEEVPDISCTRTSAGSTTRSSRSPTPSNLPYLHQDLFAEHSCRRRRASCSTVHPAAARR